MSSKILKLFNSIFVEPTKRVCLEDLLNCEFLKGYSFDHGNFIDFKSELVVLE